MSNIDPRAVDWNQIDPSELEDMAETALWLEAGAPPLHEWLGVRQIAWIRRDELEPPVALPGAPRLPELPDRMLACSREDAAALLRISVDSLDRHVMPRLRTTQIGRLVRIPLVELERWVSENSARALKG
jgi:hypothetical protein